MGNDFTTAQALFANTTGPAMVEWHLFAIWFAMLNDPLMAAVNGMEDAFIGYLRAPLLLGATVYMMFLAIVETATRNGEPVLNMGRHLAYAAVMFGLATAAGPFQQFVAQPLLNIPNELTNGVAGAAGGVNGGAAFDKMWDASYIAGTKTLAALPDTITGAVMQIPVYVYLFFSICVICVMFIAYLAAHTLLSIIVSMGPLFIGLGMFHVTRRYTMGWISAAVSAGLTLVIIAVMLGIMMRAAQPMLAKISGAPANANGPGMMENLLGVAGLEFIIAVMLKFIPSIAVGIAGGVYHQVGSYGGMLGSAGVSVASGAVGAARWLSPLGSTSPGVPGTAWQAGARVVGPSLSGG